MLTLLAEQTVRQRVFGHTDIISYSLCLIARIYILSLRALHCIASDAYV